jgi:hypothetical protein
LAILVSIPGIAEATALAMLIEMPELGGIKNKCVASLAGLAPIARDPGQTRGRRVIRGGRALLACLKIVHDTPPLRKSSACEVSRSTVGRGNRQHFAGHR